MFGNDPPKYQTTLAQKSWVGRGQLALRGQLAGIPTIVLGPADDGFELEAERLGATYVASDHLESDSLASALRHALDETHRLHPPVAEPAVSMTGGHVVH